jgi:hypothetical protein
MSLALLFWCAFQLVTAILMGLPHCSVIRATAVVFVWWELEERSVIAVLEDTLVLLPIADPVESALITGTEY